MLILVNDKRIVAQHQKTPGLLERLSRQSVRYLESSIFAGKAITVLKGLKKENENFQLSRLTFDHSQSLLVAAVISSEWLLIVLITSIKHLQHLHQFQQVKLSDPSRASAEKNASERWRMIDAKV